MIPVLLQAAQRVDPRRAIVDQFNKESWDPETWKGIVIVVSAVLILLVMLHFILYYEKRVDQPQLSRNPHRLFKEIMSQLELSMTQREILKKISRDLALESPTAMLISPERFVDHSKQWLSKTTDLNKRYTAELDRIAKKLFSSPPAQT